MYPRQWKTRILSRALVEYFKTVSLKCVSMNGRDLHRRNSKSYPSGPPRPSPKKTRAPYRPPEHIPRIRALTLSEGRDININYRTMVRQSPVFICRLNTFLDMPCAPRVAIPDGEKRLWMRMTEALKDPKQVSIISGYSQGSLWRISATFVSTGDVVKPLFTPRGCPRSLGANEVLVCYSLFPHPSARNVQWLLLAKHQRLELGRFLPASIYRGWDPLE